ncbi:hypothetical protein AQJ66_32025 [Streptomyces bungoensis]|uniref:Uncharacterized protein n=1 Tax=Streptomyces bungoensis TaxID=285568 RepID=A0A101SPX6_9ACTN|nr:hypothetical protein [Streptomyces bungoensis]KUN77853.1 hypothetical protein AQJ66_32025 [Streptomyces bungoensis]
MATALSTEIQQRIVEETGSAAPSTDDATAFEAWLDGIKDSHEDLYAGVAAEIEGAVMQKMP